jgi:hypothetical protein
MEHARASKPFLCARFLPTQILRPRFTPRPIAHLGALLEASCRRSDTSRCALHNAFACQGTAAQVAGPAALRQPIATEPEQSKSMGWPLPP